MKNIIFFCIKTSFALTNDINKMENELTILLEKKIDKIQNICDRSLRQSKQKNSTTQSLSRSKLNSSKHQKKKMHKLNLLIQKYQEKDLM